MKTLLDLAKYFRTITYNLEALDRYHNRLNAHMDSPLCSSSYKNDADHWDIERENCIVCKDLMQRIEERENAIPEWVGWLGEAIWWLKGGPVGSWWRNRRAARREARERTLHLTIYDEVHRLPHSVTRCTDPTCSQWHADVHHGS